MSNTWKMVGLALVVALLVAYFSNRGKIPIVNAGVALPKAA